MKTSLFRYVAIVMLGLACAQVHASEQTLDIDTGFRAKIAKEKVKQGFQQRRAQNAEAAGNGNQAEPSCGSQTIGAVDANERVGPAPREVFVFAPNAINIVSAGGCR